MKSVFARIILSLLGFAALAGCTKPGLDVGTLGKLVKAPQLKSGGVADTDFGDDATQTKYLQFTGTCDVHVTSMQLGFLLSGSSTVTYNDVPATSDYYASPTDVSTTHKVNDTNCSDGTFDFILSLAQVKNFLGLGNGNLSDIDVTEVYLVGVTTIGNTMPLILPTKSGDDGGGNNGGGVATQLRLTKMDPAGFAPAGYCDSFTAFLSNDSGNYASSIGSSIPFGITSVVSGVTTSMTLYSSLENCKNGVSGVSTLTLPAGKNSMQAYMRFSGADGTSANYSPSSTALTSLGLTAGGSYTVTLRGASSRWIQINDLPQTFYKNQCYAGSASFYKYDDNFQLDTTYASTTTINISSSNPAFAVYSDSSCTTPVTSLTFIAASGTKNFFAKYTSTATSDSLVSFSMITTATSTAALTVDSPTRALRADTSSHTTITAMDFQGPNQLSTGACNKYNLVARNQNYAVIANSGPALTIPLSATGGVFYSDSSCASPISGTTLAAGSYAATVYYQSPTGTTDGNYTLANTINGMTTNYSVKIHNPVIAQGIGAMFSGVTSVGTCVATTVTLKDINNTVVVTPEVATTVDFDASSGSGQVYFTGNCSDTPQTSGSFSIPAGQNTTTIYFIKSSSTGGIFQVYLPGIGTALSNLSY